MISPVVAPSHYLAFTVPFSWEISSPITCLAIESPAMIASLSFFCLFHALFDAIVMNKSSTTDVAVMKSWAPFYVIVNVSMVCIPLSAISIDLSGLIIIVIIIVIRCRFSRNVLMLRWFSDLRLCQYFLLLFTSSLRILFSASAYFILDLKILLFFSIWRFRKDVFN